MALEPAPGGYPIKLVRDGTPAIVNASGQPGLLFYRPTALDRAYFDWLRKKLGEEVLEYVVDGGLQELAQVLSVVDALALYHGASLDELRALFEADPRGGFREGVMMYGLHPEYDGA